MSIIFSKKIIDFLNNKGYSCIDKTNYFYSIFTFIFWLFFTRNNKEIVSFNLNKIVNIYIKKYLIINYKIDKKFQNSTLYYIKNSALLIPNDYSLELYQLLSFINDNNNHECNICYTDLTEFKSFICCPKCNFHYCNNCIDKIKINNKFKCVVCKISISI